MFGRESDAWIAGRFDGRMPPQMKLGDSSTVGGFVNRPLKQNEEYCVFVRAYTADDVRATCLFVVDLQIYCKEIQRSVSAMAVDLVFISFFLIFNAQE